MSNYHFKLIASVLCCVVGMLYAGVDADASVPIKLKFTEEFGGIEYPRSVAVDKTSGDLYVADPVNNRIVKFDPKGEFILTWGTFGSGAGQMKEPESVAVDNTCHEEGLTASACQETDPSHGDIYAVDPGNLRIDEFTSEGKFVRMFGGEVNKNSTNVCEAKESGECQTGREGTANGFFQLWTQSQGNLLAVGGPEHLVYVADEGRVQEFEYTGAYKGQVTLTSTTPAFPAKGKVTGVAVDAAGDLYLTESYRDLENEVESVPNGIYEFAPGSTSSIRKLDAIDSRVEGLALDESGHLAITDGKAEGELFDVVGEAPPTTFGPPGGMALGGPGGAPTTGLSFNGDGLLYLADIGHSAIEVYTPVVGPELVISERDQEATKNSCEEGQPIGALATMACVLQGTVNPEGVDGTEVWFQWGTAPELGQNTSEQSIPTSGAQSTVSAPVTGLAPNQTIYDRLAAFDQNFPPSGPPLFSPEVSFITPSVPPRIVGPLATSFIKSTSAVLAGHLNPENATGEYFAEYGTGNALAQCLRGVREERCTGVMSTTSQKSEKYQTIGATFEAIGLQPATSYRFRLNAINDKGQAAINETGGTNLPEGQFTTSSPLQPQVLTGAVSGVTATDATVSGQVDPEGEPASFAFELGIYNGVGTEYGIVESGSAGEGTAPIAVELRLSGLQASTTYAYRVKIESAYGTSYGLPVTFKTEGLPVVLPHPSPLETVLAPRFQFPETTQPHKKQLTRKQELKKVLQACKHKHSRRQRTRCERTAQKRYGVRPRKKHGKRK